MDFTSVCRTCLEKTNPLISTQEHSSDIYIITGVKVECDDGLPQTMCSDCVDFLNNAIEFRKQCITTEKKLLKIKNVIPNMDNKKQKVSEIKAKTLVNKHDTDMKMENNEEDEDEKPLKYLMGTVIIFNDRENHVSENIASEIIIKSENTETESEIVKSSNGLNNITICSLKERNGGKKNKKDLQKNNGIVKKAKFKKESPTKQKRVTCQICQKNLSIRSIDVHMDSCHPGADERKVKCELCGTYVFKDRLVRHNLAVHGSGLNTCTYCKTVFESKPALVDHIGICSKKRKRKVYESGRELRECDVCHKIMQKASLRLHKAVKHAGLGPVCEHCGRRFGNKLRLNEHYRAKHGYEKFKCSYCDFQSAGLMSMRNHERRHRGEKPFVCEQCGAKFHAAYLLSQHRQSHRTEKLFKCDQCPARFKANNNLHMHKSACHSSARYGCGLCSRTYSCRHYATRHLRSVHRRASHDAEPTPLQLPLVGSDEIACD